MFKKEIESKIHEFKTIMYNNTVKRSDYFKKIEELDKETDYVRLQIYEICYKNNLCKSCKTQYNNKPNKYCEDCIENDSCCDSIYSS
jgi:hypothetical protein